MKTKLLIFMAVFSALHAQVDPLNPNNFKPLTKVDVNQNVPSVQDFQVKEFYLDMNKKDIETIQQMDKSVKQTLDRFNDASVNYKPVIKPLSSMDSVYVHPYFTTTFLLPPGSVISHTDISTKVETLKADQNTILLRTKMDFEIANLAVIYQIGNKNQVINILLKRYENGNEDRLNLIHQYKETQKLDDLDVINNYTKVYGYLPTSKYNYIYIDDILYRIIEDDKFGTTMIKNKKYRVDTGTVYR